MKKILLFAMGVVCALASCRSQQQPLHALSIGDKMPDITFKHVLNYKDSTAKLSDFRGKLVILDFWSSWCGACINLFPHMNKLQQQFGDSLQIILVNGKSKLSGDDAAKIRKITNRVNEVNGINLTLPIVYDCPELDSCFVYNALPHEVWINGDGKVMAITSGTEVNAANIAAALAGKEMNMRLKRDIVDFDRTKPLFVDGNGGKLNDFLYRSVLTGCQPGNIAGSGSRINEENQMIGIYIFNKPLLSLLELAYRDCTFQQNLIIDETDHAIPLVPPKNDYQHLFCYDLTVPPTSSFATISSYVREDIARSLHVVILKERRTVPCLVLKAGPSLEQSFARDGKMEGRFEDNATNKYLKNYPISKMVRLLNSYLTIPLVDETGLDKKVNMKLPDDLHEQNTILQALEKAGFRVEKGKKKLDVTVVGNTPE